MNGLKHINSLQLARKQRMFDRLSAVGALKIKDMPGDPDGVLMQFNAGVLLQILREMPHCEKGLGIPRELVEKHMGSTNQLN